ncbi:MAG: DUF262 domain-containing protein [Myxococcota bacterium]|jgi:hypothetical protein|nr:DUF262 domain-containing protein [Myxococcota bacterium]
MAFQTPITISDALAAIQQQEYVLPAIQREFVWDHFQICQLFDSLMQGYPIGSFLFWRVEAERSRDYTWYGFVKDYHQRNARHCPVLDLGKRSLIAILDGQQRLTALNIGLRGSLALKEPKKRWNNPGAFPQKQLYLNLCALAEENEQGMKYDFSFMTERKAKEERSRERCWFRVSEVLEFDEDFRVIEALQELGLGNNKVAGKCLHALYRLVHKEPCIPFFEEKEQNLDKVLNIFIRVNSGGTKLSYSDLLLSIATASWKELDARKAIHGLVDELNGIRDGFQFSKDLVLKAGLMLADIPSVAFRVTNFNAKNMDALRKSWDGISRALRIGVELLAQFGFTARTLVADSVLIPLAYYLYHRGLDERYLTAAAQRVDRERVRGWVCRTLAKAGVWSGGLDTLLVAIRTALQEKGADSFPVKAVEAAMLKRGKSLLFAEAEVQDLLEMAYGDKRTFALLSLLFPHCDLRNVFHVDHVFPRSLFRAGTLRKAGVPEGRLAAFAEKAEQLPNLQLLQGSANESKQGKLPAEWLKAEFRTREEREGYCTLHLLGSVPKGLEEFGEFFEQRKGLLADRLCKVLKVATKANGKADEEE